MCSCICVCVHVCVRAYARARVRVHAWRVCVRARGHMLCVYTHLAMRFSKVLLEAMEEEGILT